MANELIINASLPETRIALMEDGEIQDLLIERASGKGIVGNIYKGRVTRVLPGMQAAFVDIGLEKAAFLYVDDVFMHPANFGVDDDVESEEEAQAVAPTSEASQSLGQPQESSASSSSDQDESQLAENEDADLDDEMTDERMAALDEEDLDSDDSDDSDDEPVNMSVESSDQPEGTLSPGDDEGDDREEGDDDSSDGDAEADGTEKSASAEGRDGSRKRRRGRRGGRNRKRGGNDSRVDAQVAKSSDDEEAAEKTVHLTHEAELEASTYQSDRAELGIDSIAEEGSAEGAAPPTVAPPIRVLGGGGQSVRQKTRPEFKEQRGRDRRIKSKMVAKGARGQVNIQDLLKEGQEVLVQVAKDPIATKGARLTCHISLPGRHLVCMPTIDHVGVSRRIERDEERRRLRDFVDRNRPNGLGFIVRTATGKSNTWEKRLHQDLEYLARLWDEIKAKAASVTAPALVYEDLNSVLRAIRDWVNEDIDKVIVDSRYHYNEISKFAAHFMPLIQQKVELYHGDVPIFDAYGISSELSRSLERKVWLKSGGYIVIDQAEALVAIDVNTGRFVGKKSLEDTILKTNLEAVKEIAYQLRLRNCGGIIILDLIDMERDETKHRVYRALEEELKRDRARPTILKISELGLIEMTRKRTRDTMVRTLCESCVTCEGKGYIKSKQTVAYEVLRELERECIEKDVEKILVQAHPDVIDVLAIEERDTLDTMERKYRKSVYLQAVEDNHTEQFEVSSDRPGGKREYVPSRDMERRERFKRRSGGGADRNSQQGGDRDERHSRDRGGRDRNRDRNDRGGRDRNERNERHDGGGRDRNREPGKEIRINAQPVMRNGGAPVASLGEPREQEGNAFRGDQPRRPIQPRQLSDEELDAIGNRVDYVPTQSQQDPTNGLGSSHVMPMEEEMTEEDRVAFQRAQAAQDAAIAKLGPNAGNSSALSIHQRRHGGGRGGRSGGGGGGGGGNGRGRRGGRGGRGGRGPRDGNGPRDDAR